MCSPSIAKNITCAKIGAQIRHPVGDNDGPASNKMARTKQTKQAHACRQNRYRYRYHASGRHAARRILGRRCDDGGRHRCGRCPRFSKFLSGKCNQYQTSSPGNCSRRRCPVNVAFRAINERFSCLLLLVRFPGEKFALIPIAWRGKAKVQTLVEPILERKSRLGSSGSKFPSEEKFFLSGK